MEHEEIVLDEKRDPRNKGTRFGIKNKGTIKLNKAQYFQERKFTGTIQDVTNNSVTVSLKKRKNWEISTRSFDDNDAKTRVVIVDNNEGFYWKPLQAKLFPRPEGPKQEEEPKPVNGTNRKGFFVREKRNPGKKGVQANRAAKSLSDGEATSDSESDSEQEDNKYEDNGEERVLCVLEMPRGQRTDIWKKGCRGCSCRGCRGLDYEKNLTAKNRKLVKLEAVMLL